MSELNLDTIVGAAETLQWGSDAEAGAWLSALVTEVRRLRASKAIAAARVERLQGLLDREERDHAGTVERLEAEVDDAVGAWEELRCEVGLPDSYLDDIAAIKFTVSTMLDCQSAELDRLRAVVARLQAENEELKRHDCEALRWEALGCTVCKARWEESAAVLRGGGQ